MTISSQLQSIYIPDFPEPPAFVADVCTPPENPTHEDVKKFIDTVQKSNQWFQENYSSHLVEKEVLLEDLEKISNDFELRIEKFKNQQRKVYRIAETVDMVIGTVGAMFIAVKTQTVVAFIFFKEKTIKDIYRETAESPFVRVLVAWITGIATGYLMTEIARRV